MSAASRETPGIEEMIVTIDRILGPDVSARVKMPKSRQHNVARDGTAVASIGLALVLGVGASAVLASYALRPEPKAPAPRRPAPIDATILPRVPAYSPPEPAPLPHVGGTRTAHIIVHHPVAAPRIAAAESDHAIRHPAVGATPRQNGAVADPLTGEALRLARIEDAKVTRELNLQESRRVAGEALQ